MPTRFPWAAQAEARLNATVDLPTPPLQLDTATIFPTPPRGSATTGGASASAAPPSRGKDARTSTSHSDSRTASAARADRAVRAAASQRAATASASSKANPDGSSSSTLTFSGVAVTPLTQPRVTTSLSSTTTPRSASTTASRVRNCASALNSELSASTTGSLRRGARGGADTRHTNADALLWGTTAAAKNTTQKKLAIIAKKICC
mmetsp:Transcript_25640/g.83077  ORF Transcript_25640/g.83077 Transcript_25640/m.83077 type:complete len:206 (-) Transcript_25640:11-628(-)